MITLTKFICEACGTPFLRQACYIARSRRKGCIITCKRGCSNRIYKKLVTGDKNPAWKGGVTSRPYTCPMCKQPFTAKRVCKRIYCSRPCYHKALELGRLAPKTENKRNWPKYHRIAEAALGRCISADEVVHHIDGNYRNNNIDNLMVLTQAAHTRLHVTMRMAIRKQFEQENSI